MQRHLKAHLEAQNSPGCAPNLGQGTQTWTGLWEILQLRHTPWEGTRARRFSKSARSMRMLGVWQQLASQWDSFWAWGASGRGHSPCDARTTWPGQFGLTTENPEQEAIKARGRFARKLQPDTCLHLGWLTDSNIPLGPGLLESFTWHQVNSRVRATHLWQVICRLFSWHLKTFQSHRLWSCARKIGTKRSSPANHGQHQSKVTARACAGSVALHHTQPKIKGFKHCCIIIA